jgi:proline iminopeptidase
VEGGKIWYEVFGSGNKTPILVLHGGPGYPSYYLNPLKNWPMIGLLSYSTN